MSWKSIKRIAFVSAALIVNAFIAQSVIAQGYDEAYEASLPGSYDEMSNVPDWLDENLQYVEENRVQVITDIVNRFSAQTEDNGFELGNVLNDASTEQLLVIQDAESLDEINNIISGSTLTDLDVPLVIGQTTQDFVFTPIAPCRIVDTRNAGGAFGPGATRHYYVYGTSTIASQGGNATGCPSPVSEATGVVLNITAIPVSGQGNFVAYPYTGTAPTASLVNYRSGVQNIANAVALKTCYNCGQEISVLNSYGTAHLVIDVLGYYDAALVPTGVDYAWGDQSIALPNTSLVTVRSLIITTPSDHGQYCVINASGYYVVAPGTGCRCSITNGTTIDYATLIYNYNLNSTGQLWTPFAATKGFYQAAGTTTTYRLICNSTATTTQNAVGDSSITATCTRRRY